MLDALGRVVSFVVRFWIWILISVFVLVLLLWGMVSCATDDRVVVRTVTVTDTAPTVTAPSVTVTVPAPTPPPPPPEFWPQLDNQWLPIAGRREGTYGQVRNLGRVLQSYGGWSANPHRQVTHRASSGAHEAVFSVALAEALGVSAIRYAARRGGIEGLTDEDGRYLEDGRAFSAQLLRNLRGRREGTVLNLPPGQYKVWMANNSQTYYSEFRSRSQLQVDGPLAVFRGACSGLAYVDRRGNIYSRCRVVVKDAPRVATTPDTVYVPSTPAPAPSPSPAPQPSNQPPSVQLANLHEIYVGGTQQLCATTSDPDGDSVRVRFSASAGQISSTGTTCAQFTAPSGAGSVTITVRAIDSKGSSSSNSGTILVLADDFGP